MYGCRSWAIRPILYRPTGTRLWGPSRWVYIPALAWSSSTSPASLSVQMRANAPSRCRTIASTQQASIARSGAFSVRARPTSRTYSASRICSAIVSSARLRSVMSSAIPAMR